MGLQINFTIRKKDNGYQLIGSYKVGRKWKQKSKQGFETKAKAKSYQREMMDKIESTISLTDDMDLLDMTFLEFALNVFLKDKISSLSETTIISYQRSIERVKLLHNIKVVDLSYLNIKKAIDDVRSRLSIGTTNLVIRILKSVIKHAMKYKLLTEDLTVHISQFPDKRTEKKLSLNDDLYIKLESSLNYKTDIDDMFILTAMKTGLRKSEIFGITWEDINFDESTISVNKQYHLHKFAPVKNKYGNRIIPIPSKLNNLFIYWKNIKQDIPNNSRVFMKASSTPKLNSKIKKHVGEKYSLHSLRHTYATRLLANNVDIKTVSALLGDTVETVINNYIHYTDDMRKNASVLIEKIL
ncbi:site-specific integrase [Dialister pneumosintes]|uniref:Tyr recombinase domain-containing protein n=1 Tax=Dialister pneumosintes TaxID=39950 RepID=A0A1B3WCT7_9FIRM|nr:site-specific integrase [Dialister pneumosintes]AOH38781.1 hypothetical protein BCB69_01565 [Dialister pneumosintes]